MSGSQGLVEGAPGEHRAFHALGKLSDAGEELEVSERGGWFFCPSGDHVRECFEEGLCVGAGFPLEFEGHERGRCLTDGATLSGELEVFDVSVGSGLQFEVNFISAGGVISVHGDSGLVEFAVVPRALGVIEDDLLVEFFEFGVHTAIGSGFRRRSGRLFRVSR